MYGHGAVGDDGDVQSDRAQRTGLAAGGSENLRVAGEAHGLGELEQLARLDFVQLVVAAQQQRHHAAIAAFDQQGFDGLFRGHLEEIAHFLDAVLARRGDLLHRLLRCRARRARRDRLGQLDVGGIVGIGAEGDGILARIRQHVEFVRAGAADGAGIRRHGAEFQPQAGENARVGFVHHFIGLFQRGAVGVEGVGILHHELARAHHAEARADLVAELGLDLVEVDRQLAVALDLAPRHVGDDFLVGRAEAELALVAVLDFQHLRAEHVPAPGFLPQFGGDHGRHQQLDGAAPVHFLAHDVFHLAQHFQAQRHPAVKAAAQALDQAGAQHQLVADQFGFGGCFLEGGEKKLGYAHGISSNRFQFSNFNRKRVVCWIDLGC